MDNQKKKNSMLESAIIGNMGHLVIAVIISLTMTFLGQFSSLSFYNVFRSLFLVVIFILTLFMWFNIGVKSTKDDKTNIYSKGVITAIISILPATFFTILYQMLLNSAIDASKLFQWNVFYVVGSPTLFWHRPFSIISEIIATNNFSADGFLILYGNLIIAGIAIFGGAIFFGKSRRV